MGLDVHNAFFGNFQLNWADKRWFRQWCQDEGLPDPFVGWVSGDNSGDQCILGPDNPHTRLAREWCRALEEKQPEIATFGGELIAMQPRVDLFEYLHPGATQRYSEDEWDRRAVAAWYAILKHGVEHGDTLTYE